MATLTEERRLCDYNLRKLCIEKLWYTQGNNEEYANLLDKANKVNITTADIIDIAQDILDHSNTDEDLTGICYDIANACYSLFLDT